MNKTAPLLITAAIISIAGKAQVQTGALYPELSATQRFLRLNNTTYRAALSAGISRHSTLGFFVSRTRFNASTAFGFNSYSTQSGGGITYNYYRYFNSRSKWGWFVNAGAGIYTIKVFDKVSGSYQLNNRYGQHEFDITPGIFFTPSKNIMLYAGLGGISVGNNKYQPLYVKCGMPGQLTIGVRITIGGGKKEKRKQH